MVNLKSFAAGNSYKRWNASRLACFSAPLLLYFSASSPGLFGRSSKHSNRVGYRSFLSRKFCPIFDWMASPRSPLRSCTCVHIHAAILSNIFRRVQSETFAWAHIGDAMIQQRLFNRIKDSHAPEKRSAANCRELDRCPGMRCFGAIGSPVVISRDRQCLCHPGIGARCPAHGRS